MLFPSQHLQAILDAARANRRFLAANIYEGAGTGEATDEAAAAIGGAMPPAPTRRFRSGVRHWPVSVGYFDPENPAESPLGEELPTYQMSFTLYENGVTNDLVMDYGDYALSGSLKRSSRSPAATAPHAERLPRGGLAGEGEAEREPLGAEAAPDLVHGVLGLGALLGIADRRGRAAP